MFYPEALLLVDYAKSEILKPYILLHKAVGADKYINLAAAKLLEHLLLLTRCAEAGEDVNLDRKAFHPLSEGLVVLPCEYGGRHQNSALLGIHDALECGSYSYLSLSEADIAAEKSVHRLFLFHIIHYLLYAAKLVVRFIVRESAFKVVLPVGILTEGIALCGSSLGIELDKLVSHILDRLFYSGSGLCPLGGVELIELYNAVLLGADILGYKVKLGNRHKQHIRSGIAYLDIVLDNAVDVPLDYALKDTDTV